MTELRTFVAGAAALLLHPPAAGGADPVGAATVRGLRAALGPEIRSLLDGWVAGGPDGEQILCLADLLHERTQHDEAFRRQLAVAGSTAAGVEALRGLAARCRRHGFWGAARWCDERGAELTRIADPGDRESAGATPTPVRAAAGGEDLTHQATRRLAELAADQDAHPGMVEALDEDAAFDLVSAALRGAEHGDIALARWEQAAGELVDRAQPA